MDDVPNTFCSLSFYFGDETACSVFLQHSVSVYPGVGGHLK